MANASVCLVILARLARLSAARIIVLDLVSAEMVLASVHTTAVEMTAPLTLVRRIATIMDPVSMVHALASQVGRDHFVTNLYAN